MGVCALRRGKRGSTFFIVLCLCAQSHCCDVALAVELCVVDHTPASHCEGVRLMGRGVCRVQAMMGKPKELSSALQKLEETQAREEAADGAAAAAAAIAVAAGGGAQGAGVGIAAAA